MQSQLRMMKSVLPCLVVLALFVGKAHGAPPKKCAIQRGAWCVAEGPSAIALHLADGQLRWKVYGGLSPSKYFEIVESPGCVDKEPAESAEVLNIRDERRGAESTVGFDLRISVSCSLHVNIPHFKYDLDREIFYLAFSAIRPCQNLACDGVDMVRVREYVLGRMK